MTADGVAPDDLPATLVDAAMERFYAAAPAERAQVLAALLAEHPAHAAALQRLFARIGAAERLLDRSFPDAEDDLPATLGGLPVHARLGEGAFGVVYRCEQSTPVVRPVAVKVLRPGAGDRHTLQRFAAERQLLASLSHPAITHVYDAGHLPDGRPFFVMEYVDGLPLVTYCERRALDCPARLRLFVALCRGVAHAHERGVVHRDLKPANVLVVEHDGVAQPKIIDFGIAKALSPDVSRALESPATDAGRVIGTPGYMSPEQAAGHGHRVDPRADVFALGVMLHELLTGELPWPRGADLAATPPLASVRLGTRARTAPATESARLQRFASRVRGDLDWIVRKATQFDPAWRYASVRDLADDVERHLAGRPVLAGPPTWRYRTAKLVRRHRVATAALALAAGFAALAGGHAWWQRQAIDAHFAAATAAAERLLQRANDPELQRDAPNEAMRQALAADALAFFDRWLAERPQDPSLRAGRAQALVTLSRVHWELGHADAALLVATQAADETEALLAEATAPAEPALRTLQAEALRHRGRALNLLHRWTDAAACSERAVAAFRACYAAAPQRQGLSLSSALRELGSSELEAGRVDACTRAYEQSIEVLEQLAAAGVDVVAARDDLVSARLALAMVQTQVGRFDDAEATLTLAAAGLPAIVGDRRRPGAAIALQQARLAGQRGERAEAARRYDRAVASAEHWVEHDPRQRRAQQLLQACYEEAVHAHGLVLDWASADRTITQALAHGEAAAAPPDAVVARQDLRRQRVQFARTLWDRFRRGDLARARAWLAQVVADDARQPPAATLRPAPWEVLALQALCRDAEVGIDAEGAARWEDLAASLPDVAALPEPAAAVALVEAWLGIVRARWHQGAAADAAAALAVVDAVLTASGATVGDDYRSQAAWWQARLASMRDDDAAVATHTNELLRLRPTWWGRSRAGDLALGCWRRARERDGADAATHAAAATAALKRVVEVLAPSVAEHPDDPWFVLPWGMAQLGLAELDEASGDAATALQRLDVALPALTTVAATAHADQWDTARVAAAEAAHRRLRTRLGR